MKPALHHTTITILSLALTSCTRTPITPNLIEAREPFALLQSKHELHTLAVNEVQDAFAALIQADLLFNTNADSPEVDRFSQIAKQKIAIAE